MGGVCELGVRCGLWKPESEAGAFLLVSRLEQCWVGPWHFGESFKARGSFASPGIPRSPLPSPPRGTIASPLYWVSFLVHFDMSLHLCHFPICLVRTWGLERLAHSGDTGGQ